MANQKELGGVGVLSGIQKGERDKEDVRLWVEIRKGHF